MDIFGNFSENKKVFNLKELYNFEIIFRFFLSDRPTQPFEWRAMENETFYWDGLTKCANLALAYTWRHLKFWLN